MIFMRIALVATLAVAGISVFALLHKPTKKMVLKAAKEMTTPTRSREAPAIEMKRLRLLVGRMKEYARQHQFNTELGFLVDMRLPSGRKRFFVYDMKKDTVALAGLVTHGSGRDYSETVQFSNQVNSYCTSLGRYKVGNAYNGRFGLAYKLHGLDATNSNAFARAVVLHSHSCVPDNEIEPSEICESLGCPTVSPAFLTRLKNYIAQSDKPLLLWVVN